MNDILLYDTAQVQADFYLQTHSRIRCSKPKPSQTRIRKFHGRITRNMIRYFP
jgi:hypothetical protein